VPVCLARQWPELRCLSPGGVELTRRLFAVVHPDMTGSVRIQATLGWLRQLLAAAQGTDAAP
jgi:hypothetical protein